MRFVCRQVELVAGDADSPFTAGIEEGERLSTGQAGEGRYFAPEALLDRDRGERPGRLRYARPEPERSARDIAGVVNEAGNVLGLMPHPEHAVDPLTGCTDGLRIFKRSEEPRDRGRGRGSDGSICSFAAHGAEQPADYEVLGPTDWQYALIVEKLGREPTTSSWRC